MEMDYPESVTVPTFQNVVSHELKEEEDSSSLLLSLLQRGTTVSSPWPSLLREMESQDLLCSVAAAAGDKNPEPDKVVWALGSLSPLPPAPPPVCVVSE